MTRILAFCSPRVNALELRLSQKCLELARQVESDADSIKMGRMISILPIHISALELLGRELF